MLESAPGGRFEGGIAQCAIESIECPDQLLTSTGTGQANKDGRKTKSGEPTYQRVNVLSIFYLL